jgi:hypothetical protein
MGLVPQARGKARVVIAAPDAAIGHAILVLFCPVLQTAGIILNEGRERAISLPWFAKSELGIFSQPDRALHSVLRAASPRIAAEARAGSEAREPISAVLEGAPVRLRSRAHMVRCAWPHSLQV